MRWFRKKSLNQLMCSSHVRITRNAANGCGGIAALQKALGGGINTLISFEMYSLGAKGGGFSGCSDASFNRQVQE